MGQIKQSIIKKIKAQGYRLTGARLGIINVLAKSQKPLTSPEVWEALKKQGLKTDRVTVYRELNFLSAHLFVLVVRLADKAVKYEIQSVHHHHLVCTSCNAVKDYILDHQLFEQEKKIYQKEKFKVNSHSLEFFGLCQKCQA